MSWEDGQHPYSLGEAAILSETDRAIEVQIDGWIEWVPKSVIHDDSEVWEFGQDAGNLVVHRWWVEKGDRNAKRAPADDDWEAF